MKRDQPILDIYFKRRHRKGIEVRVVRIEYLPTPEAEQRFEKALAILLYQDKRVGKELLVPTLNEMQSCK